MCKVLSVGRSGYYAWSKRQPSKRSIENETLTEQIRMLHTSSKQTYGSPRITGVLRAMHLTVSRPRVARLMRKAAIRSRISRKFVVTTNAKHNYPVVENILDRNFLPERLAEVWVSDITYISTREGWLYLTIVMDLADRQIIGWSLSNTMKTKDTSVPAWNMAINNRPVVQKLIFHSDRGVQYASTEFSGLLNINSHVVRSMSRKGNCWDNAVAESFFKTLKTEWVYGKKYLTKQEAKLSVFEYIETWYNTQRIHSTLNYKTPIEYEYYLQNLKIAA
jgi:putative transposase